jgi:hypothetical protein
MCALLEEALALTDGGHVDEFLRDARRNAVQAAGLECEGRGHGRESEALHRSAHRRRHQHDLQAPAVLDVEGRRASGRGAAQLVLGQRGEFSVLVQLLVQAARVFGGGAHGDQNLFELLPEALRQDGVGLVDGYGAHVSEM